MVDFSECNQEREPTTPGLRSTSCSLQEEEGVASRKQTSKQAETVVDIGKVYFETFQSLRLTNIVICIKNTMNILLQPGQYIAVFFLHSPPRLTPTQKTHHRTATKLNQTTSNDLPPETNRSPKFKPLPLVDKSELATTRTQGMPPLPFVSSKK